jgi:hypothetical protein
MSSVLMKAIFSAMVLVVMAGGVNAQTYIGGSLGYSEFPELASSTDAVLGKVGSMGSAQRTQSKTDLGFRVFAGTWMTDRLGLEFGYADLGKSTETIVATGTSGAATWSGRVATTVTYAALELSTGPRTVGETLWIWKLGGCWARTLSSASLSGTSGYSSQLHSANGAGAFLGTGFERKITSNLTGRLEFEVFFNVPVQFDRAGASATSASSMSLVTLGLTESF